MTATTIAPTVTSDELPGPDDARAWERRGLALRVAAEAMTTYGDQTDPSELERYAWEAVDELWVNGIKVSTFVPILALRRVREKVEAGRASLGDDPPAGIAPSDRLVLSVRCQPLAHSSAQSPVDANRAPCQRQGRVLDRR